MTDMHKAFESAGVDVSNLNTANMGLTQSTRAISSAQAVQVINQSNLTAEQKAAITSTLGLEGATKRAAASTALLNAALSVGVILAITAAIKALSAAWDKINVTVKESEERINDVNSKIEELTSQIKELDNLEYKTDGQEQRLNQLEQELELQEKILEIEQKRYYQELTGFKFSDAFDAENLTNQAAKEFDVYNKEGFTYLSAKYNANESKLSNIDDQIETWEQAKNTDDLLAQQGAQEQINSLLLERSDVLAEQVELSESLILKNAEYLENYQKAKDAVDSGLLSGDDLTNAERLRDRYKELYDESQRIIVSIQKANGTYDYGKEIDDTLSQQQFNGVKDQLIALGKDGELSVQRLEAEFPGLINALKDSGAEAQDLYAYIMNLASNEVINALDELEKSLTPHTSSIQQMADQLKDPFAAIGDMYKSIFENGFNANRIDTGMLSELKEALTGIEGVEFDSQALEDFFAVVGDGKFTAAEAKQAFNDLATAWFYSTSTLDNLNEKTAASIEQQLEQMGVTNAHAVVYDTLNAKTEALALQQQFTAQTGWELIDASNSSVAAFLNQSGATLGARSQLFLLALEQAKFSGQGLDVSANIEELRELAGAYGLAAAEARLARMEQQAEASHVSLNENDWAEAIDSVFSELENKQLNINPFSTEAAKATKEEVDIMAELNSELDEIQQGYEAVKEARETYNKYGKITVDQAQELINTDLRLLATMGDEENAYYALANAKLEEMKVQLARNALDTLNSLKTEADAVEYLAMANVHLRNETLSANEAILQRTVLERQRNGGAMADAASTIWQGYQNASAMIGRVDVGFSLDGGNQSTALDAFNEQKRYLEHLQKMDKISKKEFYDRLLKLAEEYLGGEENKEELWSVQEEVHEYLESIKQDYNWIDNLLESLSRKAEKLLNKADKFFSWWNKNAYINKALKVNETQSKRQFEAYQYYRKEADKVGLSKEYRDKIENGTLNIETLQDEELSEKIEQYTEWYEKCLECKDAIEELYEQERELIKQKFDNILDYYDTIDEYYSSIASKFDSLTSLKEAKGSKASIADLLAEFDNAMAKSDNAEEKSNAYMYEYNTSEEADYYRQQYDAIDNNLEATAQYKKLLDDIAKLEAKQFKRELAGKTLNKSDTAKLKQYYALKEALDKNATAETIKNYTTIYNKWYKLQQKIDSGKSLSVKERQNYNSYTEQLEEYAQQKAEQKDLLQKQIDEAISKIDGEDQKAERQKVAESTAKDLTEEHEKEVAAIQTKLQATAKYQALLKNIKKLEDKKANLEKKGKTLSEKDVKKLEDYYAKRDALDKAATASTINNYISVYDKWKKLEDKKAKLEAKGKTLSDKDKTNLDKYAEQLKAYEEEKTNTLAEMKSQLDQDIADAFAKANVENTEQSIIDAYDKTAQELRESYQKQIDDVDNKLEETAEYKKLVAQIDNKQAELDKLKAIDEDKLTKKQKNKIAKLETELATLRDHKQALDEGATAETVKEYLNVYKKWKKLDDKLTSGKSLNKTETANYDKWKKQLDAWVTAKQDAIKALNDEMQDALDKLDYEKQTQINENAAAVADAQAKVYELAKEVAEFNINNIEQELSLLDSLVSAAKSYIDLYQTMSKEKLVIAGVIDEDDTRNLTEIMEEQYNTAIDSTNKKYAQLIAQQQEYQDLIDAANNNDWDALFSKYSGDAETETIQKLKEVLEANDWDGNTWVTEWEEALANINQELIDCVNSNQELIDGLRENVYLAGVNDAIKQLGYLQNTLSSVVGLINDEWLHDADGNLTSYGTAKVSLLVEQMERAKEEVNKYAEAINMVTAMKDSYASDKAYQESLEAAKQNYFNSLSALQGYQDSIVSIMRDTDEAVINSLQTVIDKRKEALQKKKELYEYNKTIQSSQKEIDAIKAQIDALESLSGAMDTATKAKLAQLKADLADKEQALQDTKDEHTYSLQIDALDEFINTLSTTMNSVTESVNESFETYVKAINAAAEIYSQNKDYLNKWSDSIISTVTDIGSLSASNSAEIEVAPSNIETQDESSDISLNVTNSDTASTIELTGEATQRAISSLQETVQNAINDGLLVRIDPQSFISTADERMFNLLRDHIPNMNNLLQSIRANIANTQNTSTVDIHYDNLLYVEGNIDRDFARMLPDYLQQACEYTKKDIYRELNRMK